MTSLLIRNLDAALRAGLEARALKHHRSLEEEARELLRAGIAYPETEPGDSLVELARRLFGPEHGIDLDIPPRGEAPEGGPPDFSQRDPGG